MRIVIRNLEEHAMLRAKEQVQRPCIARLTCRLHLSFQLFTAALLVVFLGEKVAAQGLLCEPITTPPNLAGQFTANSTRINNPYFSLSPGQRFVFKGTVLEEGVPTRSRIVSTITDATKVIDGINAVVIIDQDFLDGELIEEELAFFAQDRARNVWTLGEYPQEFENGVFVGAPSTWISGFVNPQGELTQGGTVVPNLQRQLRKGLFLQAFAPNEVIYDCGAVTRRARITTGIAGPERAFVVREFDANAREEGSQRKYYSRKVRNVVLIDAVNDLNAENVELKKIAKVNPRVLRNKVRALDNAAYGDPDALAAGYGDTAPVVFPK